MRPAAATLLLAVLMAGAVIFVGQAGLRPNAPVPSEHGDPSDPQRVVLVPYGLGGSARTSPDDLTSGLAEGRPDVRFVASGSQSDAPEAEADVSRGDDAAADERASRSNPRSDGGSDGNRVPPPAPPDDGGGDPHAPGTPPRDPVPADGSSSPTKPNGRDDGEPHLRSIRHVTLRVPPNGSTTGPSANATGHDERPILRPLRPLARPRLPTTPPAVSKKLEGDSWMEKRTRRNVGGTRIAKQSIAR